MRFLEVTLKTKQSIIRRCDSASESHYHPAGHSLSKALWVYRELPNEITLISTILPAEGTKNTEGLEFTKLKKLHANEIDL